MNLIICCTPLQVLIAEKIIEKYPNSQFYGLMLSTVDNSKFQFYSQRLAQKCGQFEKRILHSDPLTLLKDILYFKKNFSGKKFDTVFLANINELQIHFLLSYIEFNQLKTFDDGTVNIIPSHQFGMEKPLTLKRKLVNFLFSNKYSLSKIKSLSECHYSIYKDLPNIIEKVEYINLLPQQVSEKVEHNEPPIKILLGQPIFSEPEKNIQLAQDVIKKFNIDFYFPHPRENYRIPDVNYIETDLIFEDYIFSQLKNRQYCIYTYFSSVILNLMNKSDLLTLTSLRVDVDNPDYLACYELFDKLGIKTIDIRAENE